jgi:ATP phosphoribosyltransferase regulatory subunit
MTQPPSALLPAGVHDYLPETARQRYSVAHSLLTTFQQYGYDLVLPPLVEFEQSLLPAMGNNLSSNTFRVMDSLSHEMMALRADITPQIARIATTRLHKQPRPLRLCYAGEVLRLSGSDLNYERQSLQAGIELVGHAGITADAEVITLATQSLQAIGVEDITVDLTIPPLLTVLADSFGLDTTTRTTLFLGLERKETGVLEALSSDAKACFQQVLRFVGNSKSLPIATLLEVFPKEAAPLLQNLQALIAALENVPSINTITVDMTEQRGFLYHSGVCFSLFANGFRGEIGRGGRYTVGDACEPAVGFSVYIDPLLRSLPPLQPVAKILVPRDTSTPKQQDLIAQGWRIVLHLENTPITAATAVAQGCAAWYDGDVVHKI